MPASNSRSNVGMKPGLLHRPDRDMIPVKRFQMPEIEDHSMSVRDGSFV